jgi:hypothetical protein
MGSPDVDAKISEVHDLELAIRRFDESSREIVEAASRSLKDTIVKINDELDRRQGQLAASERSTAIAAASLARCEENCGPLVAALAEAQAAEERERQRVEAAKKALTHIEAGASGFVGQQRTFSNDLIAHLPVAISATTEYAVELRSFLAINTGGSVGSPERSGDHGSGSESADESPAGEGAGSGGSRAQGAVDGSSSAASLVSIGLVCA